MGLWEPQWAQMKPITAPLLACTEPKAAPAPQGEVRVAAVDIAKGMAILCVLVGHLQISPLILNLIYAFHMPLFIAASGIFDRSRTLNEVWVKSAPLLAAYLGYGCLFSLIGYALFKRVFIVELLTASPKVWAVPFFGHFWFIIALFVLKMSRVLRPARSVSFCAGLFFAAWALGKFVPKVAQTLPLMLGPACLLGIYYVLGRTIFNALGRSVQVKVTITLTFLLSLALVCLIYPASSTKLLNYHLSLLTDPATGIVLGVTGTFSCFWLADTLHKVLPRLSYAFQYVGENALSFFALHLMAFFICKRGLSHSGLHSPVVLNCASVSFALLVGLLHSVAHEALKARMPGALKAVAFASAK